MNKLFLHDKTRLAAKKELRRLDFLYKNKSNRDIGRKRRIFKLPGVLVTIRNHKWKFAVLLLLTLYLGVGNVLKYWYDKSDNEETFQVISFSLKEKAFSESYSIFEGIVKIKEKEFRVGFGDDGTVVETKPTAYQVEYIGNSITIEEMQPYRLRNMRGHGYGLDNKIDLAARKVTNVFVMAYEGFSAWNVGKKFYRFALQERRILNVSEDEQTVNSLKLLKKYFGDSFVMWTVPTGKDVTR